MHGCADGYKYFKKKRFLLKYLQDILEFIDNLMCFTTSSTQFFFYNMFGLITSFCDAM